VSTQQDSLQIINTDTITTARFRDKLYTSENFLLHFDDKVCLINYNQQTNPSTQISNYYILFQHVCFKATITTIPVTGTQSITMAYFHCNEEYKHNGVQKNVMQLYNYI